MNIDVNDELNTKWKEATVANINKELPTHLSGMEERQGTNELDKTSNSATKSISPSQLKNGAGCGSRRVFC
jgi:hypothetical protein